MTDQKPIEQKTEKLPILAGGGLAAIVPQSIDETFRLAQALSKGGDMVPQHFQNKPEQIMAAVMRGMEIGLAPMQALANIAVINGRASLWGDALPALMQKNGHHIDVEIEGEGEAMKAVATLIRGDTGREIVREFSVADAKKANLWGKSGPWQTYPKRMLSMRARALACRDGAADAMMGLQVAEEAADMPPIKDVTPKAGGFADRALRGRAQEAPEAPPEAQPADAEVIPPEDDKAALAEALTALAKEGFPGSPTFDKGRDAGMEGKPITDCPYDVADPLSRQQASDWCAGWAEGAKG